MRVGYLYLAHIGVILCFWPYRKIPPITPQISPSNNYDKTNFWDRGYLFYCINMLVRASPLHFKNYFLAYVTVTSISKKTTIQKILMNTDKPSAYRRNFTVFIHPYITTPIYPFTPEIIRTCNSRVQQWVVWPKLMHRLAMLPIPDIKIQDEIEIWEFNLTV